MNIAADKNIVTYVLSEYRSFEEMPLNEIDSTVLSWISYLRIPVEVAERSHREGVPITELYHAEQFSYMTERTAFKDDSLLLLAAVCASPRFRGIRLMDCCEETSTEEQRQFGAVGFCLNENVLYLAFRGTDSTLVGWKEDFNMVLDGPIPSQTDALDYVNRLGGAWQGKLYVGGHSKGGNLAVYAACGCKEYVKDKILRVFSHDGPGFLQKEMEQLDLASLEGRLVKTLPQSSLIGYLFCQECDYTVVKSTAHGFGQHSPFTWTVEEGSFVVQEKVKKSSQVLDGTVNEWVEGLSQEDRKRVIDLVFGVLESTGEENFLNLGSNWKENAVTMFNTLKDVDEETKKFIAQILKELAASSVRRKK